MKWAVATCDIIRLDHFRGFEACWEIPAEDPTAVNGHWIPGPNFELFRALKNELGKLPFIAEDLGYITPEVHALRKKLDVPGMKVMQFGFGDKGAHIYLPHRFTPDSVVYTGTHDNDTTVGWWNNSASENEKSFGRRTISAMSTTEFIGHSSVRHSVRCATLGGHSRARCSRTRQRLSHEYSQQAGGQLVVAIAEWSSDAELAEKLALLTEVTDREAFPRRPGECHDDHAIPTTSPCSRRRYRGDVRFHATRNLGFVPVLVARKVHPSLGKGGSSTALPPLLNPEWRRE